MAATRGRLRSNPTRHSITDEEATLARKGNGREARLCFAGQLLMENRQGLAIDVLIMPATGTAARDAAVRIVKRLRRRHQKRRLTGGQGF